MSSHSKRSPSQISRIIRCPGSVDFVKYLIDRNRIPAEETSEFADEGTMLHAYQEKDVNGEVYSSKDLDAEQESAIEANRNWFLSLQKEHNLTWMQTERRVSLSGYGISGCGGTADVVAGCGTETLHIIDWKFGRGVYVPVDKNEQLMDYLLGAAENEEKLKGYKELWIHLGQPRLDNMASYKCDINELLGLLTAIRNSIDNHVILAGEKQCFWCRGRARCAEYSDMVQKNTLTVFSAEKSIAANEYPLEKMAKALVMEPFFKKVFKTIHDEISRLGPDDLVKLGLKRVAGRSIRIYSDADEVVKYLCENYEDIEDIYEAPKLMSPAKMEKVIKGIKKDAAFQKLIIKPLGKPTIVSVKDKRPEYASSPQIAFSHLAGKED